MVIEKFVKISLIFDAEALVPVGNSVSLLRAEFKKFQPRDLLRG